MSLRRSLTIGIFLLLAVGFLIAVGILAAQQRDGPPHHRFDLPGQEPATLYLPGSGQQFYEVVPLTPQPVAARPPAVVLVHGYSADRAVMSTLARRLAENGYAVLAIDLHGHGENRHPFSEGFAQRDVLYSDIKEAVDYLHSSQLVDPSRIVVMGHSMGSGAALDYATRNTNIAGSVMISGGWSLWGPDRPRNALFIFAQHDPGFIRYLANRISSQLAGVPQLDLGRVYGDMAKGDAVEAVEIPGVNHVQIINSPAATTAIIQWLDQVTGRTRTSPITMQDPRRVTTAIAGILGLILLWPIGYLSASLTGGAESRAAWRHGVIGLGILVIALAVAIPLVSFTQVAAFISLEVARGIVSWLAVAGLLMIFFLALTRPEELRQARPGARTTLFAAGMAIALIYVMGVANDAIVHNLALTPERLVAAIITTLLLIPFFLSFELLIRWGNVATSIALGVSGRFVIILLLLAALRLGALAPVVWLMLGVFVPLFLIFEIFAAGAYQSSRNLALIALVESAWLAWILAAVMPITISF